MLHLVETRHDQALSPLYYLHNPVKPKIKFNNLDSPKLPSAT